jgi:hypothetical protein
MSQTITSQRFDAAHTSGENLDLLQEIRELESRPTENEGWENDHRQHLSRSELEKIVKILRWLRRPATP